MSTHSPSAESLPEGYAVSTVQYGDTPYTLTYYRGFVGRAAIQPLGAEGPTLEFELVGGTYRVPQADPPETPLAGPDAQSFVRLHGGPNHRTIRLQVDNSPNGHAHGYKGPIDGFDVLLKPAGPGNGAAARANGAGAGVTVTEGGDQVQAINVRFAKQVGIAFSGIGGAARAFDGGPGGGETLIVDDGAPVCPPTC
jgi:hypothetical protein